jgi:hypothetical protein
MRGDSDASTDDIVALNAEVEGDFEGTVEYPRILFECYLGYFWVCHKSAERANVGIGWIDSDRPDDSTRALWRVCDRAGATGPEREATNGYTIPQGPSLDPADANPEPGVFLVESGRADAYPRELYASMKAEYRLTTLMRGLVEETSDPTLLARVDADGSAVTTVSLGRHRRLVESSPLPPWADSIQFGSPLFKSV